MTHPTPDEALNSHIGRLVQSLTELSQLHRDLTINWDLFCDADPLPSPDEQDGFPERLEAQGYAELVPVDDDALEAPFAAELGIYPGGSMWQLTPLGIAIRTHLESKP